MKREEFLALLRPFSKLEERWYAEYKRSGHLYKNQSGARQKEGYRRLYNAFMLQEHVQEDPLHQPLINPILGNHLRLIIHQRYQEIPFHSTEFISVDYVLQGSLVIGFPDMRNLHLQAGQLCLMNADLVHSYCIDQSDDLILNMQIEREFLHTDLLYGLNGTGPVADFLIRTMMGQNTNFTFLLAGFENDERMENMMEDLFCEYLDPGPVSDIYVKNLMRLFFTMLIRSTSSLVRTGSRVDILSILNDIENHPEHCSLKILADKYHFNTKYLGNLIKRQTGKNFQALLEDARMKKASDLLLTSDRSIRQIASDCGYSNMTFFYRHFRDKYGELPAEYRKQ